VQVADVQVAEVRPLTLMLSLFLLELGFLLEALRVSKLNVVEVLVLRLEQQLPHHPPQKSVPADHLRQYRRHLTVPVLVLVHVLALPRQKVKLYILLLELPHLLSSLPLLKFDGTC